MSQGLRTFGSRLKELADERSISLEELSKATKIRKVLIDAVFKGQREDLPDDIFIVGYLKAVLSYLDVNPTPWIDEFKALSKPESFADGENRGQSLNPVPEIRSRSHFFLWTLLVLAILVCSGLYLFRFSLPDLKESIFGSRSAPGEMKTEPAVILRDLPDNAPAPAGLDAGSSFEGLQIAAASSCWVELSGAENQKLLRREMAPGEKLEYHGKSFTISLGDSSAVQILYNGRIVEFEKGEGKVIRNLVIGGEQK